MANSGQFQTTQLMAKHLRPIWWAPLELISLATKLQSVSHSHEMMQIVQIFSFSKMITNKIQTFITILLVKPLTTRIIVFIKTNMEEYTTRKTKRFERCNTPTDAIHTFKVSLIKATNFVYYHKTNGKSAIIYSCLNEPATREYRYKEIRFFFTSQIVLCKLLERL